MKKQVFIAILIIFIIIISVTFFILNYNNKDTRKTYQISIKNFTFEPNELRIKKGETIVWTNTDNLVHTITPNQNDNLENNILSKGQTFSHTFHTIGIYRYHCDDHQNMTGTIIVE